MATDGVKRLPFESAIFSDPEILRCRELYALLQIPKDWIKMTKLKQNTESSLLLKFENHYKGPANDFFLKQREAEKLQTLELMKLSTVMTKPQFDFESVGGEPFPLKPKQYIPSRSAVVSKNSKESPTSGPIEQNETSICSLACNLL